MSHDLDLELVRLKRELLTMSASTEARVSESLQALLNRDYALADRIRGSDDEIDKMEVDIEAACLRVLALYQPMASDLRFVLAAMRINSALERMADLARSVAKRAMKLAEKPPVIIPNELREMTEATRRMVADTMQAAIAASSVDDLFLRLEAAGIMLRIDRSVAPTMARAPTIATWELDQLRTIEDVVRRGHIRRVEPGRIILDEGTVPLERDALVVHCAATGLKCPPRVPIWGPSRITLQPIRAGFPCFGAALAGYVEATRTSDPEKNRLCPPTSYGNSMAEWATMNVMGARSVAAFSAEPDIKAWSNRVALNPSRIPDGYDASALADALGRLKTHGAPGLTRLAALAGL